MYTNYYQFHCEIGVGCNYEKENTMATTNTFYDFLRAELQQELAKLFHLQGWYKEEIDLNALARENAMARRDEELPEGLAATKKAVRFFEDKKEALIKSQITLRDLMVEYSRTRPVALGVRDADQIWLDVVQFKTQKEVESAIAELQKIM